MRAFGARQRRWYSLVALAAAAAVALAFAGCTVEVDTDEDSTPALAGSGTLALPDASPTAAVDAGTPTALHVETREPSEAILVYYVPPGPSDNPIQDGTLFVRVLDPKSGAALGEDRLVGAFTGVEPVSSNSPDGSLEPRIVTGGALPYRPLTEFALGRDGAYPIASADAADSELALPAVIAPNGVGYRAGVKSVIGTGASGAVVATYALPRALPITNPTEQLNCGEPTTAEYIIDEPDMAESLLISGDGHLLVFVGNTVNSVLVDLVTEDRLDLPGYGYVAAATMGVDGYVYAVLRGCDIRDMVAQIDPKRMQLKQLAETTVQPSEWSPQDISLVAAPGGDVFFYAALSNWNLAGDPSRAIHLSVLLQLDASRFELVPISVPDNLGLIVTVGVDGKLYFYGGPAESAVSVYDPATSELSLDLPHLRAPSGTYIEALFVR